MAVIGVIAERGLEGVSKRGVTSSRRTYGVDWVVSLEIFMGAARDGSLW